MINQGKISPWAIYQCESGKKLLSDMNDEQIGHFIRASEELGVSCRYLAEEFLFETDTLEEFERLHLNPEYLKIKWRLDS